MQVNFGQVYIRPGVRFPFSHHFQHRISEEVSDLVAPSAEYIEKFGRGFDLTFNISAKRSLAENEIRGPAVFKKTKDVEFTIFLPFDVISRSRDVPRAALKQLFKGVYQVFDSLGIDANQVRERQDAIISDICVDRKMFVHDDE